MFIKEGKKTLQNTKMQIQGPGKTKLNISSTLLIHLQTKKRKIHKLTDRSKQIFRQGGGDLKSEKSFQSTDGTQLTNGREIKYRN